MSEILRDPVECERHSRQISVRQQKETPGRTSECTLSHHSSYNNSYRTPRKRAKKKREHRSWSDVGSRRIQPYRSVLQPSVVKRRTDRPPSSGSVFWIQKKKKPRPEPPTSICLGRMSRSSRRTTRRTLSAPHSCRRAGAIPLRVPSSRAPPHRPLKYFAQSSMAGFDSQTMAHSWFLSKFSRLPPCAHAGYVLRFIVSM